VGLYGKSLGKKTPAKKLRQNHETSIQKQNLFPTLLTLIFSQYETRTTGIFLTPK
jgi:hypothetical protein